MSAFSHLPLGQRIPSSVHGVSCSLPTMKAVIGYEEKDPEILRHLTSGYPRFVVHPFVKRLAAHFLPAAGQTLWLASSAHAAEGLAAHLGAPAGRFERDGLHGVIHGEDPDLAARAKIYLQHTGAFLSSREAEDHLVRLGLLDAPYPEAAGPDRPLDAVHAVLRRAYPEASDGGFILSHTGMSAFHAAWRALSDLQATRGRAIWVQLGWLYLDTIALLKKFSPGPSDYVHLPDVNNLAAVKELFEQQGTRIAGVVTEVPTNPLAQTADIAALSDIARSHGARVILDPSMVSAFNVDVLDHADIVVNSLTKYAGNEGDVIAGVIVINPAGPDAALLGTACARHAEPLYSRDLSRLAAQIGGWEPLVARTNATLPRVAAFLEGHPRVREVFWALHPSARTNYLKIARSSAHVGAMLSFTLRMPLADFYDRVRLPKGPSFGMQTSLICPFIYLAHYDLVTSETGRAELAASGLDPELMRLAIGSEPADDIIATLAEALG